VNMCIKNEIYEMLGYEIGVNKWDLKLDEFLDVSKRVLSKTGLIYITAHQEMDTPIGSDMLCYPGQEVRLWIGMPKVMENSGHPDVGRNEEKFIAGSHPSAFNPSDYRLFDGFKESWVDGYGRRALGFHIYEVRNH
jgi:hypothetical protein